MKGLEKHIEALRLNDGDLILAKSQEMFDALCQVHPKATIKDIFIIADFDNKGVEVLSVADMSTAGYIKANT